MCLLGAWSGSCGGIVVVGPDLHQHGRGGGGGRLLGAGEHRRLPGESGVGDPTLRLHGEHMLRCVVFTKAAEEVAVRVLSE